MTHLLFKHKGYVGFRPCLRESKHNSDNGNAPNAYQREFQSVTSNPQSKSDRFFHAANSVLLAVVQDALLMVDD
ncbi:hypothetical protein D9M72_184460 [compost metagenome]